MTYNVFGGTLNPAQSNSIRIFVVGGCRNFKFGRQEHRSGTVLHIYYANVAMSCKN